MGMSGVAVGMGVRVCAVGMRVGVARGMYVCAHATPCYASGEQNAAWLVERRNELLGTLTRWGSELIDAADGCCQHSKSFVSRDFWRAMGPRGEFEQGQ
jgi:hypothetical protein